MKESELEPTICTELLPVYPEYLASIDTPGDICGGVWMGVMEDPEPIVWRLKLDEDVKLALKTREGKSSHSQFTT